MCKDFNIVSSTLFSSTLRLTALYMHTICNISFSSSSNLRVFLHCIVRGIGESALHSRPQNYRGKNKENEVTIQLKLIALGITYLHTKILFEDLKNSLKAFRITNTIKLCLQIIKASFIFIHQLYLLLK